MQETGNNINNQTNQKARLVIRLSHDALSFSVADTASEQKIVYAPFIVRSGVSMAANMRDAFANEELLQKEFQRALVLIDTPVLTVPVEEFFEENIDAMFNYTFSSHQSDIKLYNVLSDLNSVAVFPINKDLKQVIDEHFAEVKYITLCTPVWKHLHKRSFTGMRNKLYGYFHDGKMELFSFNKNRFKFSNSFETGNAHDAIYFMLNVWKQLGLDNAKDELHIVGNVPERDWLAENLKRYLQKVYFINPTAEFNRAPITQIKGIPFDLQTLYIKGR